MNKANKVKKIITLIESYTGKKVFFEGISTSKSVGMTTKQFEKNPTEVDKIVKRGYDVKLIDLKENEEEFEDDFEGTENFNDEVDFDPNDFKDFGKAVEGDKFFNEFYDEDEEDDLLFENKEVSKTVDFSGELCSLIKKISDSNKGDLKKVKATIEGVWKQVTKGDKGINNNKPLPLKK